MIETVTVGFGRHPGTDACCASGRRVGPGATPSELANFGRTSTGGIDGAFTETTVRNVLVDPWLIVLFRGRFRNAVLWETWAVYDIQQQLSDALT